MKHAVTNAQIYDGSGQKPFYGTVCCEDGIIKLCTSEKLNLESYSVVDAEGLALAPGFIDAHSHSDMSILAAPRATGKISQGVTTEIIGNCGLSVYPVNQNNREHLQELYRNYNVEISWNDLTGYMRELGLRNPAVDLVPLVGHNTLRASICGYGKHQLLPAETIAMQKSMAECFMQGAFGISTGLLYVPGKFADFNELTALLETAAEYDKIYTTHLRSEGKTLLEAVNETFAAARTAALKRVHLSHLKVAGRANWHKIGALINTIEAFRAEGFEVSADRYPYTESMTQLSIILPEPYDDMDDVALENTLRDAKGFRAVYEALRKLPAERWQTVRLVSAKCYEKFCGRDFAGIAKETGDDPALICAEILHADAAGALAAFRGMSEENMLRIMEKDFVACGTDESSRPQDYSLGRSHPRGFGSMPRFCNILLNSGMPLEKVIQRMTSLPAQIFRIPGKGLVKENFTADLVLLEPDKFKDHATFAVPHQICSGIRKVWRRGKVIFENNE